MDRPVAILLAGGLARRMGGGDKCLRLLTGRPLLDHVLEAVRPQVARVALSANGDPARFAAWNVPVLPDRFPGHPGPLAGIHAGMCWAAESGARDVLSVPTDTPFLPPDLVDRLEAARAASGQPIACAASSGRRHPVVALWSVALRPALERALANGENRVGAWAAAQAGFTGDPDPFMNINTPEDLAQLS